MLSYLEPSYLWEDHSLTAYELSPPPLSPSPKDDDLFLFPLSPPFFNHDTLQDLADHLNRVNAAMDGSTPRTTEIVNVGKRDKHGKIYTKHGARYRRIRLSKEVARQFFRLQDMLGVDKPSKTLDWLLARSATAIRDLVAASGSKEETVSSSSSASGANNAEKESSLGAATPSVRNGPRSRPREPRRAEARARARERMKEKKLRWNI